MSAPTKMLRPQPEEWIDVLARARADVAAGRIHDLEDVLRDLDRDVLEMEAERIAEKTARPKSKAAAAAQKRSTGLGR